MVEVRGDGGASSVEVAGRRRSTWRYSSAEERGSTEERECEEGEGGSGGGIARGGRRRGAGREEGEV